VLMRFSLEELVTGLAELIFGISFLALKNDPYTDQKTAGMIISVINVRSIVFLFTAGILTHFPGLL